MWAIAHLQLRIRTKPVCGRCKKWHTYNFAIRCEQLQMYTFERKRWGITHLQFRIWAIFALSSKVVRTCCANYQATFALSSEITELFTLSAAEYSGDQFGKGLQISHLPVLQHCPPCIGAWGVWCVAWSLLPNSTSPALGSATVTEELCGQDSVPWSSYWIAVLQAPACCSGLPTH